MQNFDKYLESLDEGKIVLKRRYTENYPEKNVRQKASIRNTIIEALRDKKLTLSEFNEIVAQHSKSPSKWTKRNARFFNIKEDNVTLSGYGTKIANTIQPVNEGRKPITKKHWDKADDDQKEEWLLSAFSDSDDAEEYIDADWNDLPDEATSNMYESVNEAREKPFRKVKAGDVGQDYNGEDVTIVAVGKLGKLMKYDDTGMAEDGLSQGYLDKNDDAVAVESPEGGYALFTYGDDGVVVNESVNEARAPKNWDSMFTMKAIEAYKNGEFDLEDDKSIAEWDKEYNGGRAPKPAFNTKEVVSYAIKTGEKPNGDKIDESAKLEDTVRHLSDKQYNELAKEYKINPDSREDMEDFVRGCSDKDAKKIIKKYSQIKEMVYTTFTDFVNESYMTEGKWTKDKLIKAFGNNNKYHDAYIVVKGEKYIVYNPDGNNPDNDAMWGDKTVVALVPDDGDDREFKYSEIEDFILESAEINEALKSSKLRGLLSMKKSPKSLLKGIYGQTKIALDKVEDHQIVDVDPKDGPKQDGYVFYYTTQLKENPYAPDSSFNNDFPANSLLALAKGKRVFYVQSRWSRKGAHQYSLTTKPDGGRSSSSTSIGPNKSYSGWDASGLGSLARVIAIADAAFVVNPEALETTGELLMQRSQAKEGAIAFKDDKEFKDANMARYKEILTKRSSTLDVDKEIVKAIEEVADIMKSGIKNKKKDKYNQIIMGTGKNGKTFRINDLSNFTNNLMSDYERWAQYTNDAENAKARLEKEGADMKEEQWEVKYNEREALKYAKDIKDRLKKLKSKNLAW